mmetsp:Transcript_35374/g.95905  ORF Transcript_35374/g.95905 Transcript_35374/m.95905 type:complete len:239 (-) Transcript_35374:810-1526(-)
MDPAAPAAVALRAAVVEADGDVVPVLQEHRNAGANTHVGLPQIRQVAPHRVTVSSAKGVPPLPKLVQTCVAPHDGAVARLPHGGRPRSPVAAVLRRAEAHHVLGLEGRHVVRADQEDVGLEHGHDRHPHLHLRVQEGLHLQADGRRDLQRHARVPRVEDLLDVYVRGRPGVVVQVLGPLAAVVGQDLRGVGLVELNLLGAALHLRRPDVAASRHAEAEHHAARLDGHAVREGRDRRED